MIPYDGLCWDLRPQTNVRHFLDNHHGGISVHPRGIFWTIAIIPVIPYGVPDGPDPTGLHLIRNFNPCDTLVELQKLSKWGHWSRGEMLNEQVDNHMTSRSCLSSRTK